MITAAARSLKIIFLAAFSTFATGQTGNTDYDFVNHLSSGRHSREAIHLLHFDRHAFSADTLHFLLGYNHHLARRTDSAAWYFGKVGRESSFGDHASAYGVLNFMYAKDRSSATRLLNRMPAEPERKQVFLLLEGGNKLLERDYAGFDSVAAGFSYFGFQYREEQTHLTDLRRKIPAMKRKSPLVAGLLSAAVPGLGKYYAGKRGAGLAAFMSNMMLAAFAGESLYRSGYKSPQFIFFAGVFACFYSGNIVGSVYSVKLQRRSENGRIDNEILGTVHQSVDRTFGR
jgi:hypothetical protein